MSTELFWALDAALIAVTIVVVSRRALQRRSAARLKAAAETREHLAALESIRNDPGSREAQTLCLPGQTRPHGGRTRIVAEAVAPTGTPLPLAVRDNHQRELLARLRDAGSATRPLMLVKPRPRQDRWDLYFTSLPWALLQEERQRVIADRGTEWHG